MRIGCDDGLQLSFMCPIAAVAVGMIFSDHGLVDSFDVGATGGIIKAQCTQRLCVGGLGPALLVRRRAGARLAGSGEQIVGIAEVESLAAFFGGGAGPAGERGLGFVDLVGAETIEVIIAGVEGTDMIKAEPLPAAGIAGDAVGQRRAELGCLRAAGVGAGARLGAGLAAVKAGGRSGNGGRFLLGDGETCVETGLAMEVWRGKIL